MRRRPQTAEGQLTQVEGSPVGSYIRYCRYVTYYFMGEEERTNIQLESSDFGLKRSRISVSSIRLHVVEVEIMQSRGCGRSS